MAGARFCLCRSLEAHLLAWLSGLQKIFNKRLLFDCYKESLPVLLVSLVAPYRLLPIPATKDELTLF